MTYRVELTEKAAIDVERIFFRHSKRSLDVAQRWHEGFVTVLDSLSTLPGRVARSPGKMKIFLTSLSGSGSTASIGYCFT